MFNRRIAMTLVMAGVIGSCPTKGMAQEMAAAAEPALAAVSGRDKEEAAPMESWLTVDSKPKVIFFCVHGLGLHKGNYEAFGKRMVKDGISTYAIDCRGFGAWQKGEHKTVDFDGSLSDIKSALKAVRKDNPGVPIVIVGESMGGSIALRATAMYPDLIDGLISSVPAGDRWAKTEEELNVGIHLLLKGVNKPMNVGKGVVERATQNEQLRKDWENDPLGRMDLSPAELIKFQEFMKQNFKTASTITSVPVLFIQGVNDKLVRPAGTWQLFDHVATPRKQLVLSKHAEHLIFEEAQFNDEDINFVASWLAKNVLTPVAQDTEQAQVGTAKGAQTIVSAATGEATKAQGKRAGINYWLELYRDGKVYRCNNKMPFKSGDAIRFHMKSDSDGFAYVVMNQGSTGNHSVLFPSKQAGVTNEIQRGNDYILPAETWLKFDDHPGTERVSLIFSQHSIDVNNADKANLVTAFVSEDRTGAKDLVPTRMELSWDDPAPVIVPDEMSRTVKLGGTGSSVRLISRESDSLAVDIALMHQ